MTALEMLAGIGFVALVWWLRWGRPRAADVVPPHLETCATCSCADQVRADR